MLYIYTTSDQSKKQEKKIDFVSADAYEKQIIITIVHFFNVRCF